MRRRREENWKWAGCHSNTEHAFSCAVSASQNSKTARPHLKEAVEPAWCRPEGSRKRVREGGRGGE